MREIINVVEKNVKIEKIFCNMCGKEIPKTDGFFHDHLHIEKKWGYFSDHDGEVHSFDICESCYDRLIREFSLPPGE
ncbi:MAG: hypothetical protein IKD83_00445 [Firmicutes bacterium]|nr:hypothetical protein [Bacillota bacterium]